MNLSLASAQDNYDTAKALSAAKNMPACKEQQTASKWLQGTCVGQMEMIYLLAFSNNLGPNAKFCPPDGATIDQTTKVVIKYIDERPEQLHQPFVLLAIDALRKAWPCK